MTEGFSTPRTPRGSSLCSTLLYAPRLPWKVPAPDNRVVSGAFWCRSGSVVYEETAVLQFFTMANAALKAKTEANAVRFVTPSPWVMFCIRCSPWHHAPAAQALREEAQEARAELEEKRAKLIKVRRTAYWWRMRTSVVWGGVAESGI